MTFTTLEAEQSLVGLYPVAILIVAGIVVAGILSARRLTPADLTEVGVSLIVIFVGINLVIVLVSLLCYSIRPTERFADVSAGGPIEQLWADIATAEASVCKYITRADRFIQSDIGKPGHDNPSLVTAAQQQARQSAGGDLTDCSANWPTVISDTSGHTLDQFLSEATNRIDRLETTLNGFTGPQFQTTYTKTVECNESFQTGSGVVSIAELQQRMAAIKTLIQTQQSKYLSPIDQKTEELKRGQVSDCDKRRGAKVGVASAPT